MASTQRLAKFTIPRQRGVIARPRLFALLTAARSAPGLWIEGPPGAGKTTIAASYVQAEQLPCAWFRVDAGDNDLAEFFDSLGNAAAAISLGRKKLPPFSAEHARNALGFARRYFRALYQRLQVPCCVVLDDLQELDNNVVLEVIRVGVEEAPTEVRLLLLSRTAPPTEFAALEAARKLELLDERALSFTRGELEELLPQHDATAVTAIHQLTLGWSAGIILATRSWSAKQVREGHASISEALTDSKNAIFRFFAHEVVRNLPAHEQRFLQLLSLLPDASVEEAVALTGEEGAGRILDSMYRRNLFTSYRRGIAGTYQFHALFREYLRQQALERIKAAEWEVARAGAIRLLLDRGNVSDALEVLAHDAQWNATCLVLVDAAPSLLRQGRYATLLRWAEVLPAEVLQGDPWLLYWIGQARAQEDEMAACEWFDRAWQSFGDEADDAGRHALGRALAASAAILAIHLAEASYRDLAKWVSRLLEALVLLPRPLQPAEDLAVTVAIAVCSIVGTPILPEQETLATVDNVLTLLETEPSSIDSGVVNAACSLLAYCHSQRNEWIFERLLKLVDPRLRDGRISPLAHCRWLMQSSLCQFAFSLAPGAKRTVEPGRARVEELRAIVEREELSVFDFELSMVECRYAIAANDEERYATYLVHAGEKVGLDRPFALQEYSLSLSHLHLRRGEVAYALRATERGMNAAAVGAIPALFRVGISLAHGCALIASDREEEAARFLETFRDELTGRLRDVAQTFTLLARAWGVRQVPELYGPLLEKAIRQAAASGNIYFFLHIPEIVACLCADALERGIEPDFVRTCIQRRRLMPPNHAGETWPWRVRVRVLGTFELLVEEQPASFGPNTPRRQVELLQAIAAAGTKGLDIRQALDWLWPRGASGKTALDVTLHRLRKLLGVAEAIKVQDRRLHFDPSIVWSDVSQFEALGGEWLASDPTDRSDAEIGNRATRALSLYRGPLLPDAPSDAWVVSTREYLRTRFERVVQSMGLQLELRKSWVVALDLYTRVLEHDNLAEEFYRGQIRCHLALDHPAEALNVFRRCRQLLSIVLGIAPSPQTAALVQDLLAQT